MVRVQACTERQSPRGGSLISTEKRKSRIVKNRYYEYDPSFIYILFVYHIKAGICSVYIMYFIFGVSFMARYICTPFLSLF